MQNLKIETSRLVIRNLHNADIDDFYSYRKDPEVARYQGFEPFTREEAQSFIEEHSTKEFGKPGEWMQFGIEMKSTKKLIGDCAIKLNAEDHRLGEIGITISPSYQKMGFAKETLKGILNFLFGLDEFHRITETVDAENVASIKLLESVGFRKEGHFIENIFFNGKWGSEMQFAMLKSEWDKISHKI